MSMSPNVSPPAFSSGTPSISIRRVAVEPVSAVELAGVEGRGGGHDLHRRARLVGPLRRPVDQRRRLSLLQLTGDLRISQVIWVEAGDRGHHLDRPGRRLDRHHRPAEPAGARRGRDRRLQLLDRELLGAGVQGDRQVVALLLVVGQLVDDRRELVLLAGQQVVLRGLDTRAVAGGDEAVAHGVSERLDCPRGNCERRRDAARRPPGSTRR